MATAQDVAAYILESRGATEAMKLHKLVYYSKAWSLVWDRDPLFNETVEAWANGPVCRSLYSTYHREFVVSGVRAGSSDNLTVDQKASIDAVLRAYGPLSALQLSELTHSERPWLDARIGVADGARSRNLISDSALVGYYGSLVGSDAAENV